MSSGSPSPFLGLRFPVFGHPSFKRLFDLAIAVPSVIILSPLLVFIGFLVRKRIGAPIFFRQQRPGLHGRPFTIYKFRTMTDKRDENGKSLPDGERLTRLGKFLRKTSMDPQITQIFAD